MNWIAEDFEDLDNPTTYAVDPSGVYGWIESWPGQLEEGAGKYFGTLDFNKPDTKTISEVLICGMGGSAIAGDVAYAAVRGAIRVPYRVVRGYIQPGSLGKNTLQIVVSYSGNTEEAIWAYSQGHNHGANMVVITSGGALAEMAEHHKYPVILLPADCLAPRMALGYLLTAVLGVLDKVFDDVQIADFGIDDAVNSLNRGNKKYERGLPFEKNFAKKLAQDIHGVFPVVVASELTWPVAMRFQAQLNENAKWPCHPTRLPEMNHNEIVAYSQPGPATNRTGIIMLHDKDDHPRVQFRQEFTLDVLQKHVAWTKSMKGEGKTLLSRILSLIQAADYVSYYLACSRSLDPVRIQAIDELKDRLGKVQ